ncbi:protein translocase component YidC [Agromyces rhizosphaerae]|uniref:Membrane protein insertase YidC n=1 Tax=Agromyces rhizosphaerae TaxID=88374 RepID=A0A9W6CTX0_9MICO|nr:membrane protein insertase YidC [Agromyces rhizosphaerae]GLI28946.1 protein translocase component YidC [Agromyces rhizosphaerae]
MNPFDLPLLAALVDHVATALLHLADAIDPFAGPASAALAIVLATALVRACLLPLAVAQARAERDRRRLAPRVSRLREQYRDRPERLQEELRDLYAAERVSPAAGCLPMLAQAPVLSFAYATLVLPTIAGHQNVILAATAFGVPLGESFAASAVASALSPTLVVVTLVLVAIAIVAGELSRRAFAPGDTAGVPAWARRSTGALQFLTAAIVPFVPLAAGVYLATTVTWTLGQRLVLQRAFALRA